MYKELQQDGSSPIITGRTLYHACFLNCSGQCYFLADWYLKTENALQRYSQFSYTRNAYTYMYFTTTTTTCHSVCFQHPHIRNNVLITRAKYYHNSYLPKVFCDWNSLPIATIETTTLHSFTTHLCNLLIGHMKAKL